MKLKTEAREIYEWLGEKFNDYGMSSDIWSKLTELYKLAEKNQEPNNDLVKDAMPEQETWEHKASKLITKHSVQIKELTDRLESLEQLQKPSPEVSCHTCKNKSIKNERCMLKGEMCYWQDGVFNYKYWEAKP